MKPQGETFIELFEQENDGWWTDAWEYPLYDYAPDQKKTKHIQKEDPTRHTRYRKEGRGQADRMIKAEIYGSVEGYLRQEMGLGQSDLKELRNRYLITVS